MSARRRSRGFSGPSFFLYGVEYEAAAVPGLVGPAGWICRCSAGVLPVIRPARLASGSNRQVWTVAGRRHLVDIGIRPSARQPPGQARRVVATTVLENRLTSSPGMAAEELPLNCRYLAWR